MAEQLTLDHAPTRIVRSKLSPAEQWELACADNPHLKPAVLDCLRQLLDQGHRATMAVVWEELRGRIRTVGDEYQANNTWRAPAGLWVLDEHPELARDIKPRGVR
jgi:hypothetical protein